MRNKILCSICPEDQRKWEDVESAEALRKHKLEAHQLVYCQRCFKDIEAGNVFEKHKKTHTLQVLSWSCPCLIRAFETREDKREHQKMNESGNCLFACPVEGCSKDYFEEPAMVYHTYFDHSDLRPELTKFYTIKSKQDLDGMDPQRKERLGKILKEHGKDLTKI